jgi:hypothetical protein
MPVAPLSRFARFSLPRKTAKDLNAFEGYIFWFGPTKIFDIYTRRHISDLQEELKVYELALRV